MIPPGPSGSLRPRTRRGGRVVRQQPLLARPEERLSAGHRLALDASDRQPAHPLGGGLMIAAEGGLELYRVKFFTAQHRHETERTHPDGTFNA